MDAGIPASALVYPRATIGPIELAGFSTLTASDSSAVSVPWTLPPYRTGGPIRTGVGLGRVLHFVRMRTCCHEECKEVLLARVQWLHETGAGKYEYQPNSRANDEDWYIDATTINPQLIALVPYDLQQAPDEPREERKKIAHMYMFGPFESIVIGHKSWTA